MTQQLRIIISDHSRQQLQRRGSGYSVDRVRERVEQACQCPKVLPGESLGLTGDVVVPVVEIERRWYGTKAVVVTVLGPGQALKPGTIPVNV